MAKCVKIHRRDARVCVGDLSARIYVENRQQDPPEFGSVDADFSFSAHPSATQVWCLIETTGGTTLFDEVAQIERNVTHKVIMRHLPDVSAETWLRLEDGRRLDILSVANMDERSRFIEIMCAETGSSTRAAAGQ